LTFVNFNLIFTRNVMRKSFLVSTLVVFFGIFVLISCKKDANNPTVSDPFDATGFTLLFTRNFESDAHPTTGQLLIWTKSDSIVYEFKNFKTDDGPNLDVYLVNELDNVISGGYMDLGPLKGIEGNFYYRTKNTASYSFIVVWCTDFSVKFGHSITI
jgi:hypothetical protein